MNIQYEKENYTRFNELLNDLKSICNNDNEFEFDISGERRARIKNNPDGDYFGNKIYIIELYEQFNNKPSIELTVSLDEYEKNLIPLTFNNYNTGYSMNVFDYDHKTIVSETGLELLDKYLNDTLKTMSSLNTGVNAFEGQRVAYNY